MAMSTHLSKISHNAAIILLLTTGLVVVLAGTEISGKPNIIIIMADDLVSADHLVKILHLVKSSYPRASMMLVFGDLITS